MVRNYYITDGVEILSVSLRYFNRNELKMKKKRIVSGWELNITNRTGLLNVLLYVESTI